MRPSRVSDQVEGRTQTAFFRGSTYRLRLERARVAGVALAVCALAAPGATTAQASLLSPVGTFGSSGSTAGQLQVPLGVAVDQSSGVLYVADSANARIQKFDKNGNFKDAWGWGVRDGKEQSEVCTHRNDCQAGFRLGGGPVPESAERRCGQLQRRAVEGCRLRGRSRHQRREEVQPRRQVHVDDRRQHHPAGAFRERRGRGRRPDSGTSGSPMAAPGTSSSSTPRASSCSNGTTRTARRARSRSTRPTTRSI